jgi:AhpD family alkylhydroperoxidase
LGELLSDMRRIASRRGEIRALMRDEVITPSFRERLMLAVTQVNRCRYCSYAHTREALASGITEDEIGALGKGFFGESPANEVPALLYAQHWAEADGVPETSVRDQVIARYGAPVVEKMELALSMIRAGNLMGNTLDYLLHRVSFGRWGKWKSRDGTR